MATQRRLAIDSDAYVSDDNDPPGHLQVPDDESQPQLSEHTPHKQFTLNRNAALEVREKSFDKCPASVLVRFNRIQLAAWGFCYASGMYKNCKLRTKMTHRDHIECCYCELRILLGNLVPPENPISMHYELQGFDCVQVRGGERLDD